MIEGIEILFEDGVAVSIDAEKGGEVRSGQGRPWTTARGGCEVALVDREGRIGPLGIVFYNTLLTRTRRAISPSAARTRRSSARKTCRGSTAASSISTS